VSYKKFCDYCGVEINHQEKKIQFKGFMGHPLELKVQVSSTAGMGEFHICRYCTFILLNKLGSEANREV